MGVKTLMEDSLVGDLFFFQWDHSKVCKEVSSVKHFLKTFSHLFFTYLYTHIYPQFQSQVILKMFDSAGGSINH